MNTEPAMCAHKKKHRIRTVRNWHRVFYLCKTCNGKTLHYELAMCAHKKNTRSEPFAMSIGCLICAKHVVAPHLRHYFPSRTKSSATTTVISFDNSHGLRILDTPIFFVVLGPSKIRPSAFAFVLCSASPFCISHSWGTGKLDICILFCP